MATKATDNADPHAKAVAFALLSVVATSLVPLGIAFGSGADSPFLFGAGLRFGTGLMYIAFLAIVFRRVLAQEGVMAIVFRRVLTWAMVFMLVQQFDFALFALASRFVDISVVVLIYGTATTIRVVLMSFLFKRYQKIWPDVVLLVFAGLVGFWFAASADSGGLFDFESFRSLGTLGGVAVALVAAAVSALTAFGVRWGVDLARALPGDKKGPEDLLTNLCCVMTGQSMANMIGVVLQASVGFGIGESIAWESLGIAVATGALVTSVGRTAWRTANLATTNLGINAISYAIPVLSVVWLIFSGQTDLVRFDYLTIGAVAIITASLLINFEAEIRFGFKALLLALWASGTFVYLRDELVDYVPVPHIVWPGEAYLGSLALSATVFALLLSFRTTRLAARTEDEDRRIFTVFSILDLLVRRNVIDAAVRRHILSVDCSHDPEELQSAYRQAQDCIAEAKAGDIEPENEGRLADAEAELNIIVHSRRHGIEFGELFALMIFGGITVAIAMAARPESAGWTAFLMEGFAALFSAVIVFFCFNVWDLQGDRTSRILGRMPAPEQYGVVFRDFRSRRFEQGISIVIGLGIIVIYVSLLWIKWLPVGGL